MKKFKSLIPLLLAAALTIFGCGSSYEQMAAVETTSAAEITTVAYTAEEQTFGSTSDYEEVAPWEGQEEETGATAAQDTGSLTDYESFDFSSIPDYSGEESIIINDDEPMFTEEQKTYSGTYIQLSELDSLGRCRVAYGCVGQETEPAEKRGDISAVHPTGWIQKEYNGTTLYNRSHLLMFALTGLNDDERNLITGTEYFNQRLMLGWESMVLTYVDNFNGHVMYRVTPIFEGDNLVAKGVLMEAYSIEFPEEATFCRFVYNIANPSWGVVIDYATGESRALSSSDTDASSDTAGTSYTTADASSEVTYILNTNSRKFHLPSCPSVNDMSEKNKKEYYGSRDELISEGYTPCGRCNP